MANKGNTTSSEDQQLLEALDLKGLVASAKSIGMDIENVKNFLEASMRSDELTKSLIGSDPTNSQTFRLIEQHFVAQNNKKTTNG